MDCVDGHGPMLERRIAGQVVDHCSVCRGTWLDPGELWRALGRPVADEGLLRRQLVFEGLNMERDCPRCLTPLSNATVGPIVVSACMDCTGLWLDEAASKRLQTYRPAPPATAASARPSVRSNTPVGGVDPYDEGPNARPMTVHGTGVGQTEAHIKTIGNVMEGLVDVLWVVVAGIRP